jgi:hypothetical protein
MIHCSKEETEALLAPSPVRDLEPWAMQSVACARALTPKEKK